MCGGEPAAFEAARPVLAAMGKTIEHFGPSGSGQATKATNQIMCAGIIRACAEAMAFAGAHGLPLDRVVRRWSRRRLELVLRASRTEHDPRGYPAGFRVRLHAKDLGICRDMAARFGVSLPVVDSMLAEYAELIAQGFGDEDISATIASSRPCSRARRELMNNGARDLPRGSGLDGRVPPPQLYLPDFCRARAVLAIVIICELTALVLALARNQAALGSGRTWRAPRCSCCGSACSAPACCACCAAT
jgi:hypothetical protein